MEAAPAGCAGIHKEARFRAVLVLLVAVAEDEDVELGGRDIDQAVDDSEAVPEGVDGFDERKRGLWTDGVVVAADSGDGRDGSEARDDAAADIAGVKDEVTAGEGLEDIVAEVAVSIRKQADKHGDSVARVAAGSPSFCNGSRENASLRRRGGVL